MVNNKVILIGRVTKDAVTIAPKEEGQSKIAHFSLAVDKMRRKSEQTTNNEESTAYFIRCTAFDKQAAFLEQYGKKGVKFVNPKGTIEEALKFLPLNPAELMELWAEGTPMKSYNVKPSDVIPSDESLSLEKEEKLQAETVPELEESNKYDSLSLNLTLNLDNSTIMEAYAPAYEFDLVTDFQLPNPDEEKMEDKAKEND